MTVKYAETAARNKWGNVAAAKAEMCVGRKHRIFHETRGVVIRIYRGGREMISKDRIVGRERRCNDLVNTNTGTRQSPVNALNEACVICVIRSVEEHALLDGAAEL